MFSMSRKFMVLNRHNIFAIKYIVKTTLKIVVMFLLNSNHLQLYSVYHAMWQFKSNYMYMFQLLNIIYAARVQFHDAYHINAYLSIE